MDQSRRIYRELMDLEEVIPRIERYVKLAPLGIEEIPAYFSTGRILAENVKAKINLPPYTRSLMDGYAVISDDVKMAYEDSPVKLKVVGRIYAGSCRMITINNGEAVEVATGAPIPYPADAVVPVEYIDEENNIVKVYKRVAPGENVDILASDFVRGETIVYKGTKITSSIIATLISAGVKRIKVYTKVRVGIFSIGNELKYLDEVLNYGEIYDSNSYMISSLVYENGGIPYLEGIVRDDEEEIRRKLDECIRKYDIIVTIGGTSSGLEDLTYRIIDSYKPGIIIHGLKIKPGGPTAIGIADGKIIVALPGFPISCLTAANLVLLPIILRLQGSKIGKLKNINARLLLPVKGFIGKKRIVPVILAKEENNYLAYPYIFHSGSIGKFSKVDGFFIIPPELEGIKSGKIINVYLYPGYEENDVLYFGSHCPLAEKILLEIKNTYNVKIVYMGSLGGLRALKNGISDLSGIHLIDEETGSYNVPFIRKIGVDNVLLIKGYRREQGFVYRKGLNIDGLEDIIKKGYRFINRNKGSGTRTLTDVLLKRYAVEKDISFQEITRKIKGYNFEVKTHDSVGLAISQGLVDVGVAIRYIAYKYNLDFTPIAFEEFDFVVKRKSLSKIAVKYFVENIRNLILNHIKGMEGFEVYGETGRIINL